MATPTKVFTVRLPEEQVEDLEALANFDGVAVAHEIREAIQLLIAARHNDEAFRRRVRESLERTQSLLQQLEKGAEVNLEADRAVAES